MMKTANVGGFEEEKALKTGARKKDVEAPERWRDVPGFGGWYQASTEGRIRKRLDGGGWRMVKIVTGRGYSGRTHVVNLYLDGHNTQTTVQRVVAMTFCPDKMKDDAVVIHRNGCHSDNSLRNLKIITKGQSCKVRHISRRRPVMKVNQDGEPIELYPTIAAACRASGLSKKTIYRHCNREPTLLLPWGVSYRWVDT